MERTSAARTSDRRAWDPTPIPDKVLEIIADVLVACAGEDKDHPAYNEAQIQRKKRRVVNAEAYFSAAVDSYNSFSDTEGEDLSADAGLTHRQRKVWELYREGYRTSEIADQLDLSRETVSRLGRTAAIRVSRYSSAFRGLSDIYHGEVHRRTYRSPTHCTAQPCRTLGYCKFALRQIGEGAESRGTDGQPPYDD